MTNMKEDTIAAIATPFGTSGTGKVRISGPDAINIGSKIFEASSGIDIKEADSHTAHHGYVENPKSGKTVDEVLAIVMIKPRSFTGENVLEFDCHGGMVPLEAVLELTLEYGARMAEPGEFSRRAFMNGKLDMAQAEAIIDVINSKTEKSLNIAMEQLKGGLSDKVNNVKDDVMELLAHLEASIDFPEDEIEGFNSNQLEERLKKIKEPIQKLIKTAKQGKLYQEGIKTVIVGKPNVGKSSLLNYLLQENRAIVTDVPGTTRDVIEEYINLDGIPLKVIDTAGVRESEDVVEKIGVEKTRESLKKADLVLMMLDVSQGLTKEDKQVYNLIKGQPTIVVVNKTDLDKNIDIEELEEQFKEHPLLWTSVKEEKGMEELKNTILEEIFHEQINVDSDVMVTKVRHREALNKAYQSIEKVEQSLKDGMPYDFLTIDLKDVLFYLGSITGETVTDDIIDQIFSDFCLGK
ncbi:MAG: tRNA uridine-5-carboxymethylaminomethyl(34) synthesis GTPase MnmE [Halanaerobiales bacterium]|nr:tRNA uridine-5-carboxymethylaminomethyl(34) synthesis GTPase MnmE [Halanaerobiales bacterium]